ncbi:MAG: ChuX/HutX family heme-like substrate-binding protein [Pseudomonadota bacterium]
MDTRNPESSVQGTAIAPAEIRARRADAPKQRDRDVADALGISEAQLVAAHVGATDGRRALRVHADPDQLIPVAITLGEVMALTRNPSAVHEKIGRYDGYHPGQHAASVLTEDIDLRLFPNHWKNAFMVEHETEGGVRRSVQVFDAAGDAIHKIHLRDTSDIAAWDTAKAVLAHPDQSDQQDVAAREDPEAPKGRLDKVETLRQEWSRLTDTHQFLRLVSKLKMNRLGAYRIAGAPFVRPLPPTAVDAMLHAVRDAEIEFMLFVGNRGCIQIHTGPVGTLRPMGPWQNIMDPGFNLHLRADHIAEVWAVEKPTQRGPAISVEAFDVDGQLILQCFGVSKQGRDSRPTWNRIVGELEGLADVPVT